MCPGGRLPMTGFKAPVRAGAVPFPPMSGRPRLSVVCRATCVVRDLGVFHGGVGYLRPRDAATPQPDARGLIP